MAAVANEMGLRDGKLTGEVVGPIVDAKYKAKTLRQLAEKLDIPEEQTIAIGDGGNDLVMIKASGLGIAYHAKPKVNEQAPRQHSSRRFNRRHVRTERQPAARKTLRAVR